MSISPGHKGRVMVAFGTQVETGYVLADTGDGLTFRGSTNHGYVWDPREAVTVYVDAVAVPASSYEVIWLAGLVRFNAPPGGAVTMDATRLKLFTVAQCTAATFNRMAGMANVSTMGTDYQKRLALLKDAGGTLSRFFEVDEDLDPGAGTFATWDDVGQPGIITIVHIDINEDNDDVMRAWALFEQDEVQAEVENVPTAVITWQGTVPDGATKSYYRGQLFPDNS